MNANLQGWISVLIGLAGLFCLLGLTAVCLIRRPPRQLWPVLPLFYGAMILWVAGSLGSAWVLRGGIEPWIWIVTVYAGAIFVPSTWWIISFRFEELLGLRQRTSPLLLYAPLAISCFHFIAVLTNPFHHQFIDPLKPFPEHHETLWFTQAAVAFLILAAVLVRYVSIYQRLQESEFRAQTLILALATLAPIPFNLAYTSGYFDPGIDPTVFGLTISGCLFFFGIYRFRLFALGSAQLAQVLTASPTPLILIRESGTFVDCNPAAAEFFGTETCRPGENMIEHLSLIVSSAGGSSAKLELESMRNRCIGAEDGTLEHHFSLRHAKIREAMIRFVPIRSRWGNVRGICIAVRDVTNLIETRERLADTERAFLGYLEMIADPVFIHRRGDIFFANQAAADFLGRSVDDILALPGVELLHPEEREPALQRQEFIESGLEKGLLEIRYLRPDGSTIIGEVRSMPTTFRGNPAVLVTVRDLTERHRAEAIRRKLDLRNHQRERLESLGVFAGGVAHDFNNLLMGISGNCEMALHRINGESPNRQLLEKAMEGVTRAADLIRQVMAYAGKGNFQRVPLSLRNILNGALETVENSLPPNCEVTVSVEEDIQVWGDSGQLQRLFEALLLNASEAIEDRRGSIDIRAQFTESGGRALDSPFLPEGPPPFGEYARIEIEDSGCGIRPDEFEKIFEPFYSTKFVGRGLGLSAALGIIRAHGGTILVESSPGRGSKFTAYLPVGTRVPSPVS